MMQIIKFNFPHEWPVAARFFARHSVMRDMRVVFRAAVEVSEMQWADPETRFAGRRPR
ncbi:hypothetical protein [Sagittula sp. MA-2]|uniref:hypothetical protein n=1 Tax=Sagittula sp. MA-2 TaxID=3048007 RepID=UPI0024C2C023|nr:hypothetical protein [Sagittula sp. MA-2]WHZ34849.1 hypothetical protein QNI11_19725 [Sagittula sp. MA-2]